MKSIEQTSTTHINTSTNNHHNPQIQRKFEEITDDLPPIAEANGAETSTPARPSVDTGQAGNPEEAKNQANKDEKILEKFQFTKKMMVIGIVALLVVAIGITIAAVILASRRFEVIVMTSFTSNKVASGEANVETQRVTAKDPETFGTDKPVTVYANTVTRRKPKVVKNRALQDASPQQQTSNYTNYVFKDDATGTTFTVSSADLQIRASFSIPTVLQYAINNQPLPEDISSATRSLQQATTSNTTTPNETILYRNVTFYNIDAKITETVKQLLKNTDQNVKVAQSVTLDIQYNKDTNAFEFVSQPTTVEGVAFVDPKTTPVISDLNNETEVAKCVTEIINAVIVKAKEFLSKRLGELAKATNAPLVQTDTSFNTTSIYVNQPEDIEKLCVNINDNTLRCDVKALSSTAINVAPLKDGQNVDQNPSIVIHVDI